MMFSSGKKNMQETECLPKWFFIDTGMKRKKRKRNYG